MSRPRPAPGDELIVSRLEDLANSLDELARLLRRLDAQSIAVQFADAAGPQPEGEARAVIKGVLLAADFHARVTAERMKRQVVAAREAGLFPSGRPRAMDAEQVAALRAEGLGATAIARRLGVARTSVYRRLKEIEAPETRRR